MDFREKISLKSLHENDIDSWINFAWHYSQARFRQAFKNVGILIVDDKDLDSISNLSKTTGDVNGDLKSPSGKSIRFNALEIIKAIDDDKSELSNKFVATNDLHLLKVNKKLGIS